MYAEPVLGEGERKFYGGKLTENEIQATARDAMRDGWRALAREGLPPVRFSVYDELVMLVNEDTAEETASLARQITTHPDTYPWASGCPLDVEINLERKYTK